MFFVLALGYFWVPQKSPDGYPCWKSLVLKDCALLKEPTLQQFLKHCNHGKDSHWRSSKSIGFCGRDPTLEQVKSVRTLPPEEEEKAEEGTAEKMCDEVTRVSVTHPHVPLCWKEVEKIPSDVEPENKEELGGKCFKICFYFSLSYSDLIDNKLN